MERRLSSRRGSAGADTAGHFVTGTASEIVGGWKAAAPIAFITSKWLAATSPDIVPQ
jgi:hypothetical protein